MRYLLDTNICIYLIRCHPPAVLERFRDLARGDVGMSVVTLAELRHGIEALAIGRDQARQALGELLAYIPAQAFDVEATASYGVLAAAVRNRRRDALDRLIAAHAIRLGATLVTNHESDFADYPGLRIENWAR
ncbi:MAG: type II toxin-antitoxin system VapC family toxin [Burkholderiaceae bacterium]